MNREPARRLVFEAVIGVGVAAAAYFAVVEPMTLARREIIAARNAPRTPYDDNPALLRGDLQSGAKRVRAIDATLRLTDDELSVLERLTTLAQRAGLTIESIDQRPTTQAKPGAPSAPPQSQAQAGGDSPVSRSFGFTLTATGQYGRIASLITDIQRDLGLTTIESVRVMPVGDADLPLTRVVLLTTHHWFDNQPARTAIDTAYRSLASSGESAP